LFYSGSGYGDEVQQKVACVFHVTLYRAGVMTLDIALIRKIIKVIRQNADFGRFLF